MTELLPWLILMLLLMHSTDVDKLITAGATLIMIGGLYFQTAMISEPVEPTYSGVDILFGYPGADQVDGVCVSSISSDRVRNICAARCCARRGRMHPEPFAEEKQSRKSAGFRQDK